MNRDHRARLLVPVAALALLATAPAALSATAPVVNAPTPASLKQSTPLFTWTNGPAGEHVAAILIRTTPATDGRGSPVGPFASKLPITGVVGPATTSLRASEGLLAGTYHWSAWWTDPADASRSAQFTPMRSFTIPASVSTVKITSVKRGGGGIVIGRPGARPATYNITLLARVATNTGGFTGTCRITNGSKVVSQQVIRPVSLDPTALNPTGCLQLQIPSRLAGTRLKATFTVRAGGKARSAQRWFTVR